MHADINSTSLTKGFDAKGRWLRRWELANSGFADSTKLKAFAPHGAGLMSRSGTGDDPSLTFQRLAGTLGAIAVVTVDEAMTPGLVLISAQVASIDAAKHVTAIKPAYFEPGLRLAGAFS